MKEKLKQLLKEIPRSYDDFVDCILLVCDTDERVNEMIDFIENSDNASVSSVLRFSDKYDIGPD